MPSSTVKRQRRRKRIDQDGDPEFQVAPMVDVLLVLLLFFMSITSTELLKKVKKLELPEAKDATPQEKGQRKTNEIVVNVGWEPSNSTAIFTMDGIQYPKASAMEEVFANRVKQNPRAYVLIRADKDVEYSNISDVMKTCAGAGIGTVTFAVITGGATDNKNKPAPGGAVSN
jgi:biopolymer transport protein ExbD